MEQLKGLFPAFESLNSANLQYAIDTIEAFPDGISKTNASILLMSSWAAFDPHGALEYSLNGIGGRVGNLAARRAMWVWAARDPHAALAWVKTRRARRPVLVNW